MNMKNIITQHLINRIYKQSEEKFLKSLKDSGTRRDLVNIVQWFSRQEKLTTEKMSCLCYFLYSWELACFNKEIAPFKFIKKNGKLYERAILEVYGEGGEIPNITLDELEFDEHTQAALNAIWQLYGKLSEEELLSRITVQDPFIEADPYLSPKSICLFFLSVIFG